MLSERLATENVNRISLLNSEYRKVQRALETEKELSSRRERELFVLRNQRASLEDSEEDLKLEQSRLTELVKSLKIELAKTLEDKRNLEKLNRFVEKHSSYGVSLSSNPPTAAYGRPSSGKDFSISRSVQFEKTATQPKNSSDYIIRSSFPSNPTKFISDKSSGGGSVTKSITTAPKPKRSVSPTNPRSAFMQLMRSGTAVTDVDTHFNYVFDSKSHLPQATRIRSASVGSVVESVGGRGGGNNMISSRANNKGEQFSPQERPKWQKF